MVIKCNNCKKDFTASLIGRHIERGVVLYIVKCIHCKTEFPSFYENAESRQLKEQIYKLRKKYSRTPFEKREELDTQINQLVVKNKAIIDQLAIEYGGIQNEEAK